MYITEELDVGHEVKKLYCTMDKENTQHILMRHCPGQAAQSRNPHRVSNTFLNGPESRLVPEEEDRKTYPTLSIPLHTPGTLQPCLPWFPHCCPSL
uniref:Acetyltransferase n=1 Tax=Steinernema glaseri TaxID=37863 RepID=A0A1I8ARZ8_9BILA